MVDLLLLLLLFVLLLLFLLHTYIGFCLFCLRGSCGVEVYAKRYLYSFYRKGYFVVVLVSDVN